MFEASTQIYEHTKINKQKRVKTTMEKMITSDKEKTQCISNLKKFKENWMKN